MTDYAVTRTPDAIRLTQIPGKGRRKVLELTPFDARMVGEELCAQARRAWGADDGLAGLREERDALDAALRALDPAAQGSLLESIA